MERLKHYLTLICSVMIILGLSISTQAADLVGQWTFEDGEELLDLAGNFGELQLTGATIENGQLDVGVGAWAVATDYQGPEIREVTLVSWLSMDDLSVLTGSALTLDQINADEFNGIVFGERQPQRWMNGSSFFRRTADFDPGFEETETGVLFQIAISHEDDGTGTAIVRGYRDGEPIGEYTQGDLAVWPTGDAEVFFGIRHGNAADGGPGNLDAHIEEARVYSGVLSQAEILGLGLQPSSVDSHAKLAASWGAMKSD
jgi:hypothetical protein